MYRAEAIVEGAESPDPLLDKNGPMAVNDYISQMGEIDSWQFCGSIPKGDGHKLVFKRLRREI